MRNIRLTIEYDGTDYFGWQYQTNKRTIQGTVEKVLHRILQEKVKLSGAARTDAGVHAFAQEANFKTRNPLPLRPLSAGINSLLPDDIVIKNISETVSNFHARFDARWRVYRYRIILGRSPLRNRFAWELTTPLDIGLLVSAKDIFLGPKDYSVFCPVKVKNPWVDIERITLTQTGDELTIELEADRFLYKLVRRIVGALIERGQNRRTEKEIADSFKHLPQKSLTTAPPQGLALVEVKY